MTSKSSYASAAESEDSFARQYLFVDSQDADILRKVNQHVQLAAAAQRRSERHSQDALLKRQTVVASGPLPWRERPQRSTPNYHRPKALGRASLGTAKETLKEARRNDACIGAQNTSSRHESRPELVRTIIRPQDCICRSSGNVQFHISTSELSSLYGHGCSAISKQVKRPGRREVVLCGNPQSILDVGGTDPFDCLPINLNHRHYSLIDYWKSSLAASFTAPDNSQSSLLQRSVLEFATTDRALMHSLLSTFALYRSTLLSHGNDLATYSEEKKMAVQVIRNRLYNSNAKISDGTIAAVATLAATELVCGHSEEAALHLRGLQNMIDLRGGLRNVGHNVVTRLLIAWVIPTTEEKLYGQKDDAGCVSTDLSPAPGLASSMFQTQHMPSPTASISTHTSWDSCLATGFDRVGSMCQLTEQHLRLLGAIYSLTVTTDSLMSLSPPNSADVSHLCGLWLSLVDRLGTWKISPAINTKTTTAIQTHFQRVCRLSALTYTSLVLRSLPLLDKPRCELSMDPLQHIQRLLNRCATNSNYKRGNTRSLNELLLWCSFLDGMKAELLQQESHYQALGVKRLCQSLDLRNWMQVRSSLEVFLWWSGKFDEDGQLFWEKVKVCQC